MSDVVCVQGSNDGVTWVTLDSVTSSNTYPSATRSVVGSDAYMQVRWVVDRSGYVEIYEVEVYGCLGPVPSTSRCRLSCEVGLFWGFPE